jgi:MraZ protein
MGGELDEISGLAEPPHSIASAKVDDKGRLKLPSETVEWCKKSNVISVFVTTLDKKTLRIYPIPVWKSTLKSLESPGPNATVTLGLAKIAKSYGGDSDIDSQGRILLPAMARAALKLESQHVCLEHVRGRIDVTVKAVHDAVLMAAEMNLDEKVALLETLGL